MKPQFMLDDEAHRLEIVREHDAKVRPPPRDKPTMLVQVVLGGQGGAVEILQRVGRRDFVPLGVYACFPIHDGSELLDPEPAPVYPGPTEAEADEQDGYRRADITPTWRPISVCRGKKRTERGNHHRWGENGRCKFCRKTREQARLQPAITLERALKGK